MTKIDTKSDDFIAGVLTIPVAAIIIVVFTTFFVVIDGFVFSHIWNWHVVRILHLPEITLIQAAALSLVPAYFRNSTPSDKKRGNWQTFKDIMMKDGAIFLLAWVLTFFI